MNESKSTSSSGIGFLGLLTIAFITLKLCKVIDWSWWWVLAPMWMPISAVLLCAAIFFGVIGLAAGITLLLEKQGR